MLLWFRLGGLIKKVRENNSLQCWLYYLQTGINTAINSDDAEMAED